MAPLCDAEHPITLDASLTAAGGCSTALEFQFRDGATILQAWSASPTYGPFVPLLRTYSVDVRCSGQSCVSSASVNITLDPDRVPPSLGNTLRSVRKSADVVMIWGSPPEARSFSLYRDVSKGVWPPAALRAQLAGPLDTEPDVPPPLYFYRAVGASCSGREGP